MKLIAKRSFRNVASLRLKDDGKSVVDGSTHDDHIHKGAIFSIGDDKFKLNNDDLFKLRKSDSAAAEVVSLLVHSDCIGDATDAKVVEAVKLSIAEDEKREANAKKLDQAAQNQSVVNQILTMLKGLKPEAGK